MLRGVLSWSKPSFLIGTLQLWVRITLALCVGSSSVLADINDARAEEHTLPLQTVVPSQFIGDWVSTSLFSIPTLELRVISRDSAVLRFRDDPTIEDQKGKVEWHGEFAILSFSAAEEVGLPIKLVLSGYVIRQTPTLFGPVYFYGEDGSILRGASLEFKPGYFGVSNSEASSTP